MDKKVLKERLDEVKKQLRTNAKDVHFFDRLIDEALSLKGQMCVDPIALDCGKEVDEWKADTYRITLTDQGVLYHEYGGYSIFVTPQNAALYGVLSELVINKDEYFKADAENKEEYDLIMSAIAYCLAVPRLVCGDYEFMFEIASRVVEYIKKKYEELTEQPLQEETPIENAEFKEYVEAIGTLKEVVNSEDFGKIE